MTAHITVVGNATADAELRFTAKGKPVASFTVAVNERVQNEDGTWGDGDATFYRVSAWDYIAEPTYEAINKGTKVVVVGELKSRAYEDRDGNARTSLDINAKTVGVAVKAQRLDSQPAQQMEDAPF